jgi:hypothetical protein
MAEAEAVVYTDSRKCTNDEDQEYKQVKVSNLFDQRFIIFDIFIYIADYFSGVLD